MILYILSVPPQFITLLCTREADHTTVTPPLPFLLAKHHQPRGGPHHMHLLLPFLLRSYPSTVLHTVVFFAPKVHPRFVRPILRRRVLGADASFSPKVLQRTKRGCTFGAKNIASAPPFHMQSCVWGGDETMWCGGHNIGESE